MILDMSPVLTRFEQNVILKTTTQTIVNHVPVLTIIPNTIRAVVQVADKEKLNIDNIDRSLQYLQIHSKIGFKINDVFEYKSQDFKIIDLSAYGDYGYFEGTAEEIK